MQRDDPPARYVGYCACSAVIRLQDGVGYVACSTGDPPARCVGVTALLDFNIA